MNLFKIRNSTFLFLLLVICIESCKKDPVDPLNPINYGPLYQPDTIGDALGTPIYIVDSTYWKDKTTSDFDYVVRCPIYIIDSSMLFIAEGTKIKFLGQQSGLFTDLGGGILAEGTAAKPIVFEGLEDYVGSWKGIFFGTANPNNKLIYCNIKNAGSEAEEFMGGNRCAVGITNRGDDNQENCAWIEYCNFNKCFGFGVYMNKIKGKFSRFQHNSFKFIQGAPVGIPFRQITMMDKTTSYFDVNSQNTYEYVYTFNIGYNQGSDFPADGLVQNIGVPYRVYGNKGSTNITAEMLVEEGVKFEFEKDAGLCIKDNGRIVALGTASNRIAFKGTPTGPRDWNCIAIQNDNDNILDYCIIDGAGNKKAPLSDGVANIVLGNYFNAGKAKITNCIISNSYGWGIAKKQSSNLVQFTNSFFIISNSPDIYNYQ